MACVRCGELCGAKVTRSDAGSSLLQLSGIFLTPSSGPSTTWRDRQLLQVILLKDRMFLARTYRDTLCWRQKQFCLRELSQALLHHSTIHERSPYANRKLGGISRRGRLSTRGDGRALPRFPAPAPAVLHYSLQSNSRLLDPRSQMPLGSRSHRSGFAQQSCRPRPGLR